MAAATSGSPSALFDLKSAALTAMALVLKSTDLMALADALEARFGATPAMFDHDPVVIDLQAVRESTDPIDFDALAALLRRHRLQPVGVLGGSEDQMAQALAAGLGDTPALTIAPPAPRAEAEAAVPAVAAVPEPVALPPVWPVVPSGALVIDKPLRSGQQVYAKGRDLVVLAVVNFGAEVIADGNIHVYAPLRGRAIAGAKGDTSARIFCICMEPQLVSIAGTYRTTETALPPEVLGRPAQVRLVDGERLVVEALKL
ncbi:septum site-determining protein MinC [Rhizobacter sp. LjRoot28]|uniref:septum site-determining protein MinC n=1 Tax=Rhizobacter sp. LjRoot28 TaxID=3342309 RepID=UPI003ED063FC